jgi:hypothetical protein
MCLWIVGRVTDACCLTTLLGEHLWKTCADSFSSRPADVVSEAEFLYLLGTDGVVHCSLVSQQPGRASLFYAIALAELVGIQAEE